ncbi:hypothetical protein [Undibacterium squillarum]|uniref:hypothetical protein n=1 Tax=Undibacterium squillarum TaxID=1131567 RepID=UPI0035AF79E7
MANSFITYKNQDVRVNDFDLIVLVFFLEKTALEMQAAPDLKEVFLAWIDSIENDGAGNINLHLDALLENPGYAESLYKTVQEAKKSLCNFSDIIPAAYLEGLVRISGVTFGKYKKLFLQNVLDSFEEVITGK